MGHLPFLGTEEQAGKKWTCHRPQWQNSRSVSSLMVFCNLTEASLRVLALGLFLVRISSSSPSDATTIHSLLFLSSKDFGVVVILQSCSHHHSLYWEEDFTVSTICFLASFKWLVLPHFCHNQVSLKDLKPQRPVSSTKAANISRFIFDLWTLFVRPFDKQVNIISLHLSSANSLLRISDLYHGEI